MSVKLNFALSIECRNWGCCQAKWVELFDISELRGKLPGRAS